MQFINPLEQIHNSKKRMPVIRDEESAWEWLFGKMDEERVLEIATSQSPATNTRSQNKLAGRVVINSFFVKDVSWLVRCKIKI